MYNSYMFNKNIYYVYAYLRSKDSSTAKAGTPYYIGKGKDNRAYDNHRRRGKGVYTPTDTSLIVFLETNLSEIGSFAIERRMIAWYNRKDLGTGILLNRTDGGEGGCGAGFKPSAETIAKRSKALTGRKRPLEDCKKISKGRKGIVFTDEHRKKLCIGQKNRPPITDETRAKMREARTGLKRSEEAKENMRVAQRLRFTKPVIIS